MESGIGLFKMFNLAVLLSNSHHHAETKESGLVESTELKYQKSNDEFGLEWRNRFSALTDPKDEGSDINSKWKTIKKFYI